MEMFVLGHCAPYFAMRILTRQERVKLNSLPLVVHAARFPSFILNDFSKNMVIEKFLATRMAMSPLRIEEPTHLPVY